MAYVHQPQGPRPFLTTRTACFTSCNRESRLSGRGLTVNTCRPADSGFQGRNALRPITGDSEGEADWHRTCNDNGDKANRAAT